MEDSKKQHPERERQFSPLQEVLTESLKRTAVPLVPVVFSRKNYKEVFKNGIIQTPVDTIKFGESQYTKLSPFNRNYLIGAIYETLTKPALVANTISIDKKTGNWTPCDIYSKSFIYESGDKKVVDNIVVFKGKNSVVISSHPDSIERLVKQIKTANDLVYLDKEVSRVASELIESHAVKGGVDQLSSERIKSVVAFINPSYDENKNLSINNLIESGRIEKGYLEINKENFYEYFNTLGNHFDYKNKPQKIVNEMFNQGVSLANKADMKEWITEQGFKITSNTKKSIKHFQDINQNVNNSQEENNMAYKPMTSVMNVEGFFNKEFTASELAGAIEELDFYSDEIKQKYNLENDPNAERTFVFGTLAANTIIEKYEDGIGIKISDNALDEIYKIGIEVAQGKYESYAELEPKLDKFLQNPKNSRPYSTDMRNLEKVLDTWEQRRIETTNGTGIDTGGYHPDSVWIDNWRIRTISDDDQEWYLTYKGQEVIRCKYNEAICIDEKPLIEGEKIIGDVLQVIQNKTDAHCPQIEPGSADFDYQEKEKQLEEFVCDKNDKSFVNPAKMKAYELFGLETAKKIFDAGIDITDRNELVSLAGLKALDVNPAEIQREENKFKKHLIEKYSIDLSTDFSTPVKYKPSQDYFIDKMNHKEREFYKNPPYPEFAEKMEKAKEMAEKLFNPNEENSLHPYTLGNYHLEKILPRSRHPNDKDLFCVMAKNNDTGKYAVWTSFNTDMGKNGSLNHGHYDIKNLNDAAKIMCDFSNSKPLHIEHHQHYKQNNDVER